jgi:hypothetical protein
MERLWRAFEEVDRKIGAAAKWIQSLMEMDFDPNALAQAEMSDKIFDVIPGSRSRIMEEHNKPMDTLWTMTYRKSRGFTTTNQKNA